MSSRDDNNVLDDINVSSINTAIECRKFSFALLRFTIG